MHLYVRPHFGVWLPESSEIMPLLKSKMAFQTKFLFTSVNHSGGGGGGEGNLHMIRGCAIILGTFWGCSQIFGYLFGLFPDFWVSIFWLFPYFWISFLLKIDFFQNNPDFEVLILIFPSMTLWNDACRAIVSMILQFSFLFCYAFAKSSILSITAISLSSYICSTIWF